MVKLLLVCCHIAVTFIYLLHQKQKERVLLMNQGRIDLYKNIFLGHQDDIWKCAKIHLFLKEEKGSQRKCPCFN